MNASSSSATPTTRPVRVSIGTRTALPGDLAVPVRPDLAGSAFGRVMVPALFIVGAQDGEVVDINRRAIAPMHHDTRLEIVPGATRLFEEAATLASRKCPLTGAWNIDGRVRARDLTLAPL